MDNNVINCNKCNKIIKINNNKYYESNVIYCYRCYLLLLKEIKKKKEEEEKRKVLTRMERKKFYCKKCGIRLNDFGVSYFWGGQHCLKCGEVVVNLVDKKREEEEYYKELLNKNL